MTARARAGYGARRWAHGRPGRASAERFAALQRHQEALSLRAPSGGREEGLPTTMQEVFFPSEPISRFIDLFPVHLVVPTERRLRLPVTPAGGVDTAAGRAVKSVKTRVPPSTAGRTRARYPPAPRRPDPVRVLRASDRERNAQS